LTARATTSATADLSVPPHRTADRRCRHLRRRRAHADESAFRGRFGVVLVAVLPLVAGVGVAGATWSGVLMAVGCTVMHDDVRAGWEGFVVGRVVPMRFGDVEVLVEAIQLGGNEPTSVIDRATGQVVDAVQRVRSTLGAITESVTGVVDDLAASRAAHPEKIEVEVGLGFSMKGSVVVVSGGTDASLKVKLTYTVPCAAVPDTANG